MSFLSFFECLNEYILGYPTTVLFFAAAVILTIQTRFLQIRGFGRFLRLIRSGVRGKELCTIEGEKSTINPFHALFAAMSTTIGMGSVVGPSVAIMSGGPGALFWLMVYIFLGSATKFVEVVFALDTRVQMADGRVIGGPMQYLRSISSTLAWWYGFVMIFLFAGWSGFQANTLATIYAHENIPSWLVGLGLACIVVIVLQGGAERVGIAASRMVPFMFVLYIFFACFILYSRFAECIAALNMVIYSVIKPSAAIGGFVGTTLLQATRAGIYKAVFITESGLGTSSIAHAVADTRRAIDQGLLAMYSGLADIILSFVSGMVVLVTGVWSYGELRSSLIYEAFKLDAPGIGQIALLVSVTLFVLTTIIGNSFNGSQTFALITGNRGAKVYQWIVAAVIFTGALMPVPLIWQVMETLLALVAIPNLIGIVILAFRRPSVLGC